MPIRPQYKWFYPIDWPQLSAMIRFERAEGRCQTSAATRSTSRQVALVRVFLCHSSGDKTAVRKLYRRLESYGIDPWLDKERILPGQECQTD